MCIVYAQLIGSAFEIGTDWRKKHLHAFIIFVQNQLTPGILNDLGWCENIWGAHLGASQQSWAEESKFIG